MISDRGERYLPQCLEALERFEFPWAQKIVIEDPLHQFSQNGVIVEAWSRVDDDIEYVAWLEEDFLIHDFPLAHMVRLLEANPDLANLVLKRQPWNGQEHAAGGIIECYPDSYEDCEGFLRHRRFFSLNPCVIPKRVIDMGWAGSEGDMTDRCLAAGMSFSFYGCRFDPPRVEHIGYVRG